MRSTVEDENAPLHNSRHLACLQLIPSPVYPSVILFRGWRHVNYLGHPVGASCHQVGLLESGVFERNGWRLNKYWSTKSEIVWVLNKSKPTTGCHIRIHQHLFWMKVDVKLENMLRWLPPITVSAFGCRKWMRPSTLFDKLNPFLVTTKP